MQRNHAVAAFLRDALHSELKANLPLEVALLISDFNSRALSAFRFQQRSAYAKPKQKGDLMLDCFRTLRNLQMTKNLLVFVLSYYKIRNLVSATSCHPQNDFDRQTRIQ